MSTITILTTPVLTELADDDMSSQPWSKKDSDQFAMMRNFMEPIDAPLKISREDIYELYQDLDDPQLEDKEAYEKIKRKYLALKIMNDDKLIKAERNEIYYFLTGGTPPVAKKGASDRVSRDMVMAFEYLCRIHKGGNPKQVKSDMKSDHGFSEDTTFYKAISRGRGYLETVVSNYESPHTVLHRLVIGLYGPDYISMLLDTY